MMASNLPEIVELASLSVSRICFGCGSLGSSESVDIDQTEVRASVLLAAELGVNFFDTADVYGLGQSETCLAQALGELRTGVTIATKGGIRWNSPLQAGDWAATSRDNSPDYLRRALTASLERLRLNSIPLYFLHWPDPQCKIEVTMEAFAKLRDEKMFRYIGLSNVSASMIRRAHKILPLAAVQVQYSLIDRRAELEILPCCRDLGIAVLVYGGLGQGLLSGKYRSKESLRESDRRHRLPQFQQESVRATLLLLDKLSCIAAEYSCSPAQIALRWLLDNPDVHCIITGIKKRTQVEENLAAFGWRLAPQHLQALGAIAL